MHNSGNKQRRTFQERCEAVRRGIAAGQSLGDIETQLDWLDQCAPQQAPQKLTLPQPAVASAAEV